MINFKPPVLACAVSLLLISTMELGGADAKGLQFSSHQSYIAALNTQRKLDLSDPAKVLEYVLSQSAKDISVQPTENYSYFKFYQSGIEWRGNMRLEIENGLPDKLHFAYFVVPAPWHSAKMEYYKAFSAKDGLKISQQKDLSFEVAFKGHKKSFHFNDIRHAQMPDKMALPDEKYMGQVHDESGLRFFLVMNQVSKNFTYILDQKPPFAEKLVPYGGAESNLVVGVRTGFVFIKEPSVNRMRLIGVYSENVSSNNYFDGPFDQLPDGYEGKMTVKKAFGIIDANFAEMIDKFGNFKDREDSRVVIAPYVRYLYSSDFDGLKKCRKSKATSVRYSICVKEFLEESSQ